jgi:tetratricopeptide (TPR) repeat protein
LLADQRCWVKLEEKGREVLSNNPNQNEAMALVAYSLQQQGRLEEALAFATQSTVLHPNGWLPNFIAGVALNGLGRKKEACKYLRQALALSPNDRQTILQLIEAGDPTQMDLIPEEYDPIKPLRLLVNQSSWTKLEEKGREVLLINPNQDEAMALVAYSLQQQGRLEEALAFAAQATVLSPNSWLPNFTAGIALNGLGRKKEASKYLRQAIAISPNHRQTILQLIDAIASSEGMELAAAEYVKHCSQIGIKADIAIASISTVQDWAQKTGLSLLDAGDVEEIPFETPHVWGMDATYKTTIALSNKPYVADITDARIFSNSSIILTSDGTALSDTAGHPKFGRYVSFAYEPVVLAQQPEKVILNFSDFKTREIEAGIYLSGLASNAFGHWLPEFLPKLQFLKQHLNFINLPLIVDKDMPQSHFDHLRRLADNPLILLQANESLLCRRLLVAPSPAFSPVELFPNDVPVGEMPGLSPRAMCFLRGNELFDSTKSRYRRIFLARKNMRWRRLLNEEEIAADLSKLGFETIFIEELTAREQIDLFQQALWIVAPNGSALLNLIFADQSVKLLVLTQPNLFNWGTFQGPMDSLGYQSVCVCGEYAVATDQKHSDYRVPKQLVRQALAGMGMNEALV